MPPNKEIEITISLKDAEATKKIQSFRSTVKEFSTATKSSLAPILQLRQAWMKTSLAVGAITGAAALGIRQIDVLNSEIISLDKSSAKLGISTSELSKKIYGFNIATNESRIGVSWYKSGLTGIGNAAVYVRKALAELPAAAAINAEMGRMEAELIRKATQAKRQQNPFRPYPFSDSEMGQIKSQATKEKAIQNLLEVAQKQKEVEALKNGTVAEAVNKSNQLEMSGYAYKVQLLKEEVAAYRAAGVDKITLSNYEVAARKRIEEDYTSEVRNQQATILEAQGNTLEALRMKQENALDVYKRQWGADGEATREFIRGQQAIYNQAQYTYLGIRDGSWIMHDGFVNIVGSMTNTFSNVFCGVITGEINNLGEAFSSFGKQIIKTLSDMLAQYVIAQAILGISSLFKGGTITGGVGGRTIETAQFGTTWSPYHTGGVIPRAHGGLNLAPDEVPIIAQTGERVLSRAQNREYEKGIGGKRGGDGTTINNNNFYINATDPKSFEELCRRSPGGIADVAKLTVLNDFRTNGDINRKIRHR